MTTEAVLDVANRLLSTALTLSFPLLAVGMTVGLIVAVFQAATQIQEASLSFVPKLVAVGVALIAGGAWMLDELLMFTRSLFELAAGVGG